MSLSCLTTTCSFLKSGGKRGKFSTDNEDEIALLCVTCPLGETSPTLVTDTVRYKVDGPAGQLSKRLTVSCKIKKPFWVNSDSG